MRLYIVVDTEGRIVYGASDLTRFERETEDRKTPAHRQGRTFRGRRA